MKRAKGKVLAGKHSSRKRRPAISVTGFWMHNRDDGYVVVLVEHKGQWLRVFDNSGPGPTARDQDQMIDCMIYSSGVQNLMDYGSIYGIRRAPTKNWERDAGSVNGVRRVATKTESTRNKTKTRKRP